MTKTELMEIAKYGIEKKIEGKCGLIADTCVTAKDITDLKRLIEQYDEIVQMYNTACELQEANP